LKSRKKISIGWQYFQNREAWAIMEQNFNNDELEQFLREEADEHTMYPSEHVWENIRLTVQGETSWHALTFGTLLILIVLTTVTLFNYPPKTIAFKTNKIIQKAENITETELPAITDKTTVINLEDQISPENITKRTLETIQQNLIQNEQTAITKIKDLSTFNSPLNVIPAKTEKETALKINRNVIVPNPLTTVSTDLSNYSEEDQAAGANNHTGLTETRKSRLAGKLNASLHTGSDGDPSADALFNDFTYSPVVHQKQKTRFELQFYATPSVSYRKLVDDESRVLYQQNAVSSPSNINSFVRHTPALGFELGSGIAYALTPNFKIKTGLQFNIRQYYIDAYQSYGIATFAIVQNNHLDSVQLVSLFSNTNNYNNQSTKIDNKLYQLSIPIGLQWDIINGKKFGLSVSGSIQPTVTLNKNVYMISTDYKNYANGAPFFRKWNLNSSAEINFTYNTGNVKWYVGPQFRYQQYPTYNNEYPIKEYRLDYGLKLGISTPIFK